jgi:CelD/BcsL family acetyltransferase involved in cellulose biosynthesis
MKSVNNATTNALSRVEVLASWSDAEPLHQEWNELARAVGEPHPFLVHGWFSCWYAGFAADKAIRILLLREGNGRLRAIFPGVLEKRKLGGLSVDCFSYAANGHSPYGGIIARAGDHEAIGKVLQAAAVQVRPTPHLLILPGLTESSDTSAVIRNGVQGLGQRCEHVDESFVVDVSSGWDAYFSGCSSSTRQRIKRKLKQAAKRGPIDFPSQTTADHSAELIHRLRRLDSLTWQGQHGTGLFSNKENERCYRQLLSSGHDELGVKVFFLTIDGQDAAYDLTLSWAGVRHVLKMGYDPDFADCSPGAITMWHIGTQSEADGIQQLDIGAGANDEKRHWATRSCPISNWWLVNRKTWRGYLLETLLRLHDHIRFRKKSKKEHVSIQD